MGCYVFMRFSPSLERYNNTHFGTINIITIKYNDIIIIAILYEIKIILRLRSIGLCINILNCFIINIGIVFPGGDMIGST